jgi:hypothetical protein
VHRDQPPARRDRRALAGRVLALNPAGAIVAARTSASAARIAVFAPSFRTQAVITAAGLLLRQNIRALAAKPANACCRRYRHSPASDAERMCSV